MLTGVVLVGPQQLLVLRWHQVHDGGQHVRELSDAARRGLELGRQLCIDRTPLGLDLRQERLDRALLVDNLFKPTSSVPSAQLGAMAGATVAQMREA